MAVIELRQTNRRDPFAVYSPEWWLRRLLIRLHQQRYDLRDVAAFYDGTQPLMFASEEFNATFGERYQRLPANFMPRVVNAERERLVVQGFRFGDATRGDKDVWGIWQRNQLDAESMIAHQVALVKSLVYTLVSPSDDGPLVTIEDPSDVIVEMVPGNRRKRAAALKVWTDIDDRLVAYLYLPEFIFKYRSVKSGSDLLAWAAPPSQVMGDALAIDQWETFELDGEDWPIENPMGVVPIVPLINRPELDGTGRSEIKDVMGNQNAINYLRFAALIGSDVAALPQRWARNLDIPIDAATGRPIQPFKTGKHTLWTTRRPSAEQVAEFGDKWPETEFGQFPAANLNPFIDLIREQIIEMAAISGTPYYQLVGPPTSVAPSGESIKASEATLVKKSEAQAIHFGEGWEETMRLALIADGQESKARADAETMWADPETRNEAARTDSIIKQHAAGLIPDEFALEELGYSQQQIQRILDMREQEELSKPEPPSPPPTTGLALVPSVPEVTSA